MKRKFLLVTLFAVLLFTGKINAQKYDFSQSTATYAALKDSARLISFDTLTDNDEINAPITFNIKLMDRSYNSLTLDATGKIYGSTAIPPLDDILLVMGTALSDVDATSGIYYKSEGTGTNHIFKMEYKNAGTGSGAANWQVWLYETSNVIEVRFGPNTVSSISGFDFGGPAVSMLTADFTTFTTNNVQSLSEDPSSPTMKSALKPNDDPYVLNAMPANGTVYKFTPKSASSSIKENNVLSNISMYPNPARQGQEVTFTVDQPNASVNVTDIAGKLVYSSACNGSVQIPTTTLAQGIYFITVANSTLPAQKLMIEL